MISKNRILLNQPDYLFVLVRRPADWRPKTLEDVPPSGEPLSRTPVASYAEALDDLLRSNRLALKSRSLVWATIESPGADL